MINYTKATSSKMLILFYISALFKLMWNFEKTKYLGSILFKQLF
jgi:hypothetical protein